MDHLKMEDPLWYLSFIFVLFFFLINMLCKKLSITLDQKVLAPKHELVSGNAELNIYTYHGRKSQGNVF